MSVFLCLWLRLYAFIRIARRVGNKKGKKTASLLTSSKTGKKLFKKIKKINKTQVIEIQYR